MKAREIFIKTALLLAFVGIVFVGCASDTSSTKTSLQIPAPVFDRPHAIVLDLWNYGIGSYKDYVKVYNSTSHEQISFNVFGYDETNSRWVIIGTARLKKITDSDTIDSPLNRKLNVFRWFAIHSLDNLDFNAHAIIRRNDVLITVFEEGAKAW